MSSPAVVVLALLNAASAFVLPPTSASCRLPSRHRASLQMSSDVGACTELLRDVKDAGSRPCGYFCLQSETVEACTVETVTAEEGCRTFAFSGGTTVGVREIAFSEGKLGHELWDAGVAHAIWLCQNRHLISGKRVLELGAGCGLTGLLAAHFAESVTLSEFGFTEDKPQEQETEKRLFPTGLLDNLRFNAQLNEAHGLAGKVQVQHLDWHYALRGEYQDLEEYEVVIGADLVYYPEDVDPLIATIKKTIGPTGVFYFMTRTTNRKPLQDFLTKLGAEGTLSTEEHSITFIKFDPVPLVLVTFRNNQ